MSRRAALRLGARDLRGGMRRFRIFLACLALGVAAIATIGGVREGLKAGLAQEGATLLGGDASVELSYRRATDAEWRWFRANADAVSEVVNFRSMLSLEGGQRALTQVKAVDAAWPIYGAPELAPPIPLAQALAGQGGRPGIVLDPLLIDSLGLDLGDEVRLGDQEFVLMAALVSEPDNAAGGFSLAPRSLVRRAALDSSGLLAPGSLYDVSYRLRLPPGTDLDALERAAGQAIAGARWHDRRNGAPGIRFLIERLSAFLVLVGLAGLLIGGVGVAAAVRAWLEDKVESIAVLKSLGADAAQVWLAFGLQIAALSLVGIAIGLVIGLALPWALAPVITNALPVPADFSPRIVPMAEAAGYGLLTAALFTLWPLAQVGRIGPAALFRENATGRRSGWPGWCIAAASAGVLAALVGLAAWRTGEARLVLWAAAGFAGAALALSLVAFLARRLAKWASRQRFAHGRPALRLALSTLGAAGGELRIVVLSLGLGLSVLATIGQIDGNLRGAIKRDLPDVAPSFFVVDIQPGQIGAIQDLVAADPGVRRMDAAPMLRGVITKINDRPAAELAGDHWVLQGDRGVTYSATPPTRTRVVAGQWWPPDYEGPPQISFGADEAREMGLKLGDRLTVNILGRDVTGTITSLREVDFSGAGMGFVLAMNPAALAGVPHSWIASIYASRTAEPGILRALTGSYSNITVISVRGAIERITGLMGEISAAIAWGAAVTLLTGLVVLMGAATAGYRGREYEAALLKTLGATRGRIMVSFAWRTALAGAAAGLVAVGVGAAGAWGVTRFVMEQSDFRFEPLSAAAVIFAGIALTLISGLAVALRALATRPAQVLRARD